MNKKRQPSDEQLRRAMATLDHAAADEDALDDAFGTVIRAATRPSPPKDFSRRTMLAVKRAPLPDGRQALTQSSPVNVPLAVVLAAVAAATAYGVIVTWGAVTTRMFVRTVVLALQACLSVVVSLSDLFDLWHTLATIGTAVADALTLSGIATVLIVNALVGVLSLTALARLLSSDRGLSQ